MIRMYFEWFTGSIIPSEKYRIIGKYNSQETIDAKPNSIVTLIPPQTRRKKLSNKPVTGTNSRCPRPPESNPGTTNGSPTTTRPTQQISNMSKNLIRSWLFAVSIRAVNSMEKPASI
jgi:hypothetical protein